MSKIWAYFQQLVGNSRAATIGIFTFILILCSLFWRCSHAGEIDVRAGTSFGTEGWGPVLGLQFKAPLPQFNNTSWYAGTLLWGSTRYKAQTVPNNWDWAAGVETCRGRFCGGLGMTYMQRIDAINGAHTNFMLSLSYKIDWRRLSSLDIVHISDAGTSDVNIGRQALLGSIRLQ